MIKRLATPLPPYKDEDFQTRVQYVWQRKVISTAHSTYRNQTTAYLCFMKKRASKNHGRHQLSCLLGGQITYLPCLLIIPHAKIISKVKVSLKKKKESVLEVNVKYELLKLWQFI